MPLSGEAWDMVPVAPSWIQPSTSPYHVDFLASVTPAEVRASTMHPCCDVLPVLGVIKKGLRSAKDARAKREVERTIRAAGIKQR